jgi:protease-4
MSLDADYLVDRRRLKRRLVFWRIAAVIALVLAVVVAVGQLHGIRGYDHVARLTVDGLIVDDRERAKVLDDVAADDSVKALIVRINSPGGTVVGGEVLYNHLRRVSQRKPVVAVMGEFATSAAYMTALGSDYIIAHEGTVTGSIGVILQTTDLTGLLDKIGIKPEAIKSGPLKAQPNPLEPFTPEAREAVREVILDLFQMFVKMVEERRQLPHEEVLKLADGRIFAGRQALDSGLIDALGGELEAREWLDETRDVKGSIPVKDLMIGGTKEVLREVFGETVGKALFSERLRLDGLISLWHPNF